MPADAYRKLPLLADILLRMTLWICLPVHLGLAYVLARPDVWLGQQLALPTSVPPLYATMTALTLALLGATCAWLALCRRPTQSLLILVVIAHVTAFASILGLWAFGQAASGLLWLSAAGLVLAMLWLWWYKAAS